MTRKVQFSYDSVEVDKNCPSDLLRRTFSMVCDKQNWKGPIDCEVPNFMVDMVCEAIRFMTGSCPVIHGTANEGRSRITAPGYYAAVGA